MFLSTEHSAADVDVTLTVIADAFTDLGRRGIV